MMALTLLAAIGLVGGHVISHRLAFLDVIPRSRLLSASGGAPEPFLAVRPGRGRLLGAAVGDLKTAGSREAPAGHCWGLCVLT